MAQKYNGISKPTRDRIPYGRQDIDQTDIDAVVGVLQSDFLTQGPKVPAFEDAIIAQTGAQHCVASHSATAALHMACIALGVGQGDSVWTVPTTFVASANCALYCGAQVDFVDIDPELFTMCPDALREKLVTCDQKPKVIIPVHLCGQSADMKAIHAIAAEHGIRIIEDASHAIGAKYDGAPVGDCRYSDIAVFSFHPVKIITTAEGGAATTNDPKLAQLMGMARSHGITRDADLMENKSDGPWYYEQLTLGYNYRMTELQAALGASQMNRLPQMIARRSELADRYHSLLANVDVKVPTQSPDTASSWHLYVVRVAAQRRRQVFEYMASQNIGVNLHYIPVHLQPYYQHMGFKSGQYPNSEAYYARAISIPLYYGLTDDAQDYVVATLRDALAQAF